MHGDGSQRKEEGGLPGGLGSRKSETHHEVTAEVVLSPLVPFSHGGDPLDKLSQDAGLVHPSPRVCRPLRVRRSSR